MDEAFTKVKTTNDAQDGSSDYAYVARYSDGPKKT